MAHKRHTFVLEGELADGEVPVWDEATERLVGEAVTGSATAVQFTTTSTADMAFVVDEDDMVSNSATKVPTQQSVKAYVDASGGGGGTDDQTAAEVPIADAGGYYTGTDVEAALQELGASGGTDDQTAAEVPITDAGGYFTGTDVEAALQELGAGSGGGGGGTEQGSLLAGIDNRSHYASQFGPDEGYDQEFDGFNIADNTFPTNWSNISMEAAAVYRQWFGAGRVDWGGGGDATNLQIVARTLPATTTFDAIMHLWGAAQTEVASYTAMAVLYNSVNGRAITLGCFNPSTTDKTPDFYVSYYSDVDTSSAALAGPVAIIPNVGLHGYYWIKKVSDSSYTFYWSPDGGCFFTVGSALNVQASVNGLDGDPTHIGFALNTSGAAHVGCEWLRIRNLT